MDYEEKDKRDYKKIVWLASYPKSGNTWARCFFDAYFMNEVDINDILCSVTDDMPSAHDIGDGTHIKQHRFEVQQLARPMALLRITKAYLDTEMSMPFFVKTHNANLLINGYELLPEVLTKATICIIRDPRDILPSYSKHMGVDMGRGLELMEDKFRMLGGGDSAIDFTSSWHDHINSFLNCETHNIKYFLYEDMKADPVKVFSLMLEHAGVEPDKERVKKAVELVELNKLSTQEKEVGFKESSKHAKNKFFGAKHRSISIKNKLAIEKKQSRLLKRLGYEGNIAISKVG